MSKNSHKDILHDSPMSTKELINRTQEVEDEKERKKQERLEKKLAKEKKKKQERTEKLIAPFLLIATLLLSLLVRLFTN